MILDLGAGKSVVGNADLGVIWTQISANRGSLGVGLTPEQAMEYGLWLFQAGRKAKKDAAATAPPLL